jgi:hypothetical protein
VGSFKGCLKETPVGVQSNPTPSTLVTFGAITFHPITFGAFTLASITFGASHIDLLHLRCQQILVSNIRHQTLCQCNWHGLCFGSICRIGLMSSHAKLHVVFQTVQESLAWLLLGRKLPDRPFMGFMRASILPPEPLVKGE